MINNNKTIFLLERIANALDRLAPPEKKIDNLNKSEGLSMNQRQGLLDQLKVLIVFQFHFFKALNHKKSYFLITH